QISSLARRRAQTPPLAPAHKGVREKMPSQPGVNSAVRIDFDDSTEIDFRNRFPMIALPEEKGGKRRLRARPSRGHCRREEAMIATDIFTELRRGGRGRREVIKMLGSLGVVAVSLPLVGRNARADEDLTVFDWSGYEIPELHKPYIAKYGKSPTITIFADDEEAYVKIKAGFRCDLVHPTSYAVSRHP